MKILLNILTHGDEMIGLAVAKEIQKLPVTKGEIVVHIANERAYKEKKRFIDQDLNRSFPGKRGGNHEEKLAARITPVVKSADIVIDIHSTTSGLKDALIVTKLNKKTREYIEVIGPKYLLYMRATKNNALMSEAKIGIAFEYGADDDTVALTKIVLGIKRLLSHLGMIERRYAKNSRGTLWLDVYKTVPKTDGARLATSVKNYRFIKKGSVFGSTRDGSLRAREDFYPVLFGEKNYHDIFGFAARLYRISKTPHR